MSQHTFVGREEEQEQYRKFLDEMTAWMLVITGLGGIGKSTLLHRFAEQTPSDTSVVTLNFAEETSLRTDPLKLLEVLALSLKSHCDVQRFDEFMKALQKDHDQLGQYHIQLQQRIQDSNAGNTGKVSATITRDEDVSIFTQKIHQTMQELRHQMRELAIEAFFAQMDTFKPKRLVIMFDTGELLNEPESWEVNQWLLNDFLPRLHAHMYRAGQNCFIVIASRVQPESQVIDEHDQQHMVLSMLDESAVDLYLERFGIDDLVLRKQVYEVTHGHALCIAIIGMLYRESGQQSLSKDMFAVQKVFDERASIELINERILNNLKTPFKELTQYGVFLRSFNLPLLKAVFPTLLPDRDARDLFALFIRYPFIESLGNYRYAFHELIREVLTKKAQSEHPEEWKEFHKKALDYFSASAGVPSAEWHYHALAYSIACGREKEGMASWRQSVLEANIGGAPKDTGTLLQIAYDQTLQLSPLACAERDYEQGRFNYFSQQWGAALRSYSQAFDFFEQMKDQQGQATVLRAMGDVQRAQGILDAALQSYKHARGFYEAAGDRLGQAKVLQAMGSVLQTHGELEAALASYKLAFHLFGLEGDLLGQADVCRTMGDIQQSLDRREAALECYSQAMALYEEAGSDRGKIETEQAKKELNAFYAIAAPADGVFVARLKSDLQVQGITIWTTQEAVESSSFTQIESIRRVMQTIRGVLLIASPETHNSRNVRGELRIAQMYQRPVYVVWVAGTRWMDAAPLGWAGAQLIDAREARYQVALREIATLLRRTPSTPLKVPDQDFDPRNPYKGLRAFGRADSNDFFGRERLVHELVQTLEKTLITEPSARLLTVIGPSGSGKSSVVMAGLLPQLQRGALPGSEAWTYLVPMVPGQHPIEALALTLVPHFPSVDLKRIRENLDDDAARGLCLLATALTKRPDESPGAKVVLLIDQFEELFTHTISEYERRHFINVLVSAITEPKGSVIIILTMRADFYDRPLLYPELSRLIQAHLNLVLPMDVDDLRSVIENPAALPDAQLMFEDDLIGDLLFEVQGQAGTLPLLQFTLDQLFERRRGHMLTLQAYREIGGVRGALARHAESTYTALPSDEHRSLARALFMRLIDPGVTEQDTTRRRATLTELSLPDPAQTKLLQEVVNAFITARLLVSNEFAGTSTLEVSHEALIREWARLAEWLREAREDIRLQQSISKDVAEWEIRGRPGDRLYRGSQLREARAWVKRNRPSNNEAIFLRASTIRTRRTQYFFIIATIVTLLASTLSIGLLLFRPSPNAASVTSLGDAGSGSLRQAIAAARSGDTITFAATLRGTIILTSGDLNISKNLTLRAPGTGTLAISNGNNHYSIHIFPHATVVIVNINLSGSSGQSFIYNEGTLTLTDSIISGNRATNGGSIFNQGSLTLTNSTVSDNVAFHGGGVIVVSGQANITFCTIFHNAATNKGNGGGISSNGGGISIGNSAVVTLRNSIVAENQASVGPDISGNLVSNGYNLIQNFSGAIFTDPFNKHHTDISMPTSSNLGIDTSLQHNGGPTQTHALLPGSPAIDGVPLDACSAIGITTDQRGVKRPQGLACDIGAFERAFIIITPTPTATPIIDVSGAASTIDTFCNYLNSGAIQGAYNLTSQSYQNQHSVSEFANQFSNADLFQGGCLHNKSVPSNGDVTVQFSFSKVNPSNGSSSTSNYAAILIQDSQSGTWVIDNIIMLIG